MVREYRNELHIGYKGLPLGFLETYPIISLFEDPAMGTTSTGESNK